MNLEIPWGQIWAPLGDHERHGKGVECGHTPSEQHMTVTTHQLIEHFAAFGLEAVIPDGGSAECGAYVDCHSYRDLDGAKQVLIRAVHSDGGQKLVVTALGAYQVSDCRFRAALHLVMLLANSELTYARFELDEVNGFVHVFASMPVMGSNLSQEQFGCLLEDVLRALESYYPVVMEALRTGRVDMSLKWQSPAVQETPQQTSEPAHIESLREFITSIGGPTHFETLLRHLSKEEARR